jgi:glycine oxidase
MTNLIIGNGIIALTIAYRLLRECHERDDAKILIVGPGSRPGSASLAAGAMLNSFAEVESDTFDHDVDLARFEMSYEATRMWPKFERELIDFAGDTLPSGCASCQGYAKEGGCAQEGTYVINNTAADDLDDVNFNAILDALVEFNEPHQLISPTDIPGYKPTQRARATRAVLIHNEGWYNPRLFVQKLENLLRASPKVSFIDNRVIKLHELEGSLGSIELDSGVNLSADNFILATGSGLSSIVNASNLSINVQSIFHGIGVSLEVRLEAEHQQPNCIRTPNRGLACGIYSVPYFWEPKESRKSILLGATNFISPELKTNARISNIETIIRAASSQINTNFYKAELVRTNVGSRPVSSDTYPLIGKTEIKNLYIVSGTKRDGFHLSPLISQLIVDQIYGKPTNPRYKYFSPDRQLIRNTSREDAIRKAVRHLISAAYQHDFNPSGEKLTHILIESYRADLERLHDKVGAYDWGIPVELIDMYRYEHIK